MKIIGITGTIGAGKGTIVEFLVTKHGYRHFSVRTFLTEEIKKRNIELNRDSMTNVANELRAKYGPSYIVDQLYQEAKNSGNNAIIESIRTPLEVTSLQKKGNFYLMAVDADPHLRYERIVKRNSETDQIDFDTFLANEEREMQNEDPNKQNLRACIEAADIRLSNNGNMDDLISQLNEYGR